MFHLSQWLFFWLRVFATFCSGVCVLFFRSVYFLPIEEVEKKKGLGETPRLTSREGNVVDYSSAGEIHNVRDSVY